MMLLVVIYFLPTESIVNKLLEILKCSEPPSQEISRQAALTSTKKQKAQFKL